MSGLSIGARVVHVVLLGVCLGGGLVMNLLVVPDAQTQLQSKQLVVELVTVVMSHLDFCVLVVSPIILLSLFVGYFSLGVPLKARVIIVMVVSGLVAIRSQWLSPEMTRIYQSFGRPLQDVVASDSMKIQYINLEVASLWLHWAQLALILYLLVLAVISSAPKRKFGISF
jgi:hypothetical protein